LFLKVIVWIVIVLVIVSGVAVIFLTKGMGAVKKVELKPEFP
jgi:hypothetical protein